MSIKKLERENKVGPLRTSKEEIHGLFKKAKRKLADSEHSGISDESRLEHAYTCILICATVALRACGYRVTDVTSFHYVSILTLSFTIKLSRHKIKYFQQLRSKRHSDIYSAMTTITETEANQAVKSARKFLKDIKKWMDEKYPELVM